MLRRAVELGGGLEEFVLAGHGSGAGFRDDGLKLGIGQGLESARRFKCLVETLHGVAPVDDDRRGQVERIVETFDGSGYAGFEGCAEGHGLHAEDRDAFFDQSWDNFMREAPEVKIEHIERHLAGIEMKVVLGRDVEHS